MAVQSPCRDSLVAEAKIPRLLLEAGPRWIYSAKQTPIDLKALLYIGGTASGRHNFPKRLAEGMLGQPRRERIRIVEAICQVLRAKMMAGAAKQTITSYWTNLCFFVSWVDTQELPFTIDNARSLFQRWCWNLQDQVRLGTRSPKSIYSITIKVSELLAEAVDVPASEFRHAARLKRPLSHS